MSTASTAIQLPRPFTLRASEPASSRVQRLVFEGKLALQPGQFVMAWLPGLGEKPFGPMDDDPLSLAVARVGPFSEALHRLAPGERLWLRGPFGRGFTIAGRRPLLVAGGYGVAPLALLAKYGRRVWDKATVVLAARTAGELALVEHFERLGCTVVRCTDDGSAGLCLLADAAADQLLTQSSFDRIFACGPEGMLDAIEQVAIRRRLPAQLSREAFMRCGIGVCGSCTCGDRLVCLDGPVFDVACEG